MNDNRMNDYLKKRGVTQLYQSGARVEDLSCIFNVSRSTVYNWIHKVEKISATKEINQLRSENDYLRKILDYLIKSPGDGLL